MYNLLQSGGGGWRGHFCFYPFLILFVLLSVFVFKFTSYLYLLQEEIIRPFTFNFVTLRKGRRGLLTVLEFTLLQVVSVSLPVLNEVGEPFH